MAEMEGAQKALCLTLAEGHLSDRLGKTHEERYQWMIQWLSAAPRTVEDGTEMVDWLRSLPAAPPKPSPGSLLPDHIQGDGSQASNIGSPVTLPAKTQGQARSALRNPPATRIPPRGSRSPQSSHALVEAGRRLEVGLYEIRDPSDPQQIGRVFVVRWNKDKSNKYPMRVVHFEEDGEIKARLEYEPDAIFDIKPTDRMNKYRAIALSSMLGFCIRCCRKLEDPKSVEQSMGPVCIGKI